MTTSLCLSCLEDPATLKHFIELAIVFRLYVEVDGKMKAFRSHYAKAGQMNPGDYIIYISGFTNNLFVGKICQHQPDMHEAIRVLRIPRSFGFREDKAIDNIQWNEVPCVLIPV